MTSPGTVFADHQLTIPEMFPIIRGMEEHTTNEIFQELDRTYKTVLEVAKVPRDLKTPLTGLSELLGLNSQH